MKKTRIHDPPISNPDLGLPWLASLNQGKEAHELEAAAEVSTQLAGYWVHFVEPSKFEVVLDVEIILVLL